MPPQFSAQRQAFNRTRETYLATALAVADTHWTRLRGLLGLRPDDFRNGCGIWITPCHGVHTLGMKFPIDVVYLDPAMTVIYIAPHVEPWRFTSILGRATSVLELPSHKVAETGTALGDRIEIISPTDSKEVHS
jgi:uncharacterized protein